MSWPALTNLITFCLAIAAVIGTARVAPAAVRGERETYQTLIRNT